jgi:hypothetical protein
VGLLTARSIWVLLCVACWIAKALTSLWRSGSRRKFVLTLIYIFTWPVVVAGKVQLSIALAYCSPVKYSAFLFPLLRQFCEALSTFIVVCRFTDDIYERCFTSRESQPTNVISRFAIDLLNALPLPAWKVAGYHWGQHSWNSLDRAMIVGENNPRAVCIVFVVYVWLC